MRVADLSTKQMDFVNHNNVSKKFDIGTVYSFYGKLFIWFQ